VPVTKGTVLDTAESKNHPAQQWLERKLCALAATIRVARTVAKEFRRHTGGRTLFAATTITLAPAAEFSLTFSVEPVNWISASELDFGRARQLSTAASRSTRVIIALPRQD
jgi:hypothetical protein